MKSNKNKIIKNSIFVVCIVVIITCVTLMFLRELNGNKDPKEPVKPSPTPSISPIEVNKTGDFTVDIIKEVNSTTRDNYLLSPYNIEVALNLLREGANGNTKDEIDKVIGNRTINDIRVENTINVANAVFVKNDYKNNVKKDFLTVMKDKFNSEVLYDAFKTPDVINNWVKKETKGMIQNILSDIDDSFMVGVASALAIDVKWQSEFECVNTTSEEFTKLDNSKMNTEMMHQTYKYGANYIKMEDAKGIIIPYRSAQNSNVNLEFIALLPNTNVSDYVNNLTSEKLNNIFNNTKSASDKYRIRLSLPRFTYSYSIDELEEPLQNLGIKDVFSPGKADLSRMVDIRAYVGTAIHKTFIELSETGTKAAAVTYFGVDATALPVEEEYEIVDVKFNKPFVYMIRDKSSGEILFFGSVFEPNKWKGSTCSGE